MITPMVDLDLFRRQARRVRARVPTVLSRWGLVPKFKRWRLTQDPETGLVVLFAVLNNKYIATHTSTPFSDYFDPRLLHDMANDLNVQVVSCNTDGLRYAFILDRGSIDKLPTYIEFPILDGNQLFVRVVFNDKELSEGTEPQITPAPLNATNIEDDLTLVNQGVKAFLKVFDDISLRDEAAAKLSAQDMPVIVVVNESEFNKDAAEQKADL
jgi:hypothetical protein